MAVAISAQAAAVTTGTAVQTLSGTNMTAGGSDTAILVFFATASTTITNLVLTWGSQTLTQLVNKTNTGINLFLFGGLNPQSGAQTMLATWTGSTNVTLTMVTLTGTSVGAVGSAFKFPNTNSGTSTTSSVTISGGVSGDMCFAMAGDAQTLPTGLTATGSTQGFTANTNVDLIGSFAPGAASVAWSGAMNNGSAVWAIVGISITQPPTAPLVPGTFSKRDKIQIWDH